MSVSRRNITVFISEHANQHDPGPECPETPARLHAVLKALKAPEFETLGWVLAKSARDEDLERAHSSNYLKKIRTLMPDQGLWNLDKDTVVCPGSLLAAAGAAGAVCAAVDNVFKIKESQAFCAIRPPGHHAEREHALGFCLLNSLAIGAQRARYKFGVKRIAIIDIDAHHGNGAQNIFWDDPNAFIASIHEAGLSLPTGDADETGAFDNILNCPLRSGAGSTEFREAFTDSILPRLYQFRPEVILVAAGFDGHRQDPLANLNLREQDFQWIASVLSDAAWHLCDGKLIASLEGGYNLDVLGSCSASFIRGLMFRNER